MCVKQNYQLWMKFGRPSIWGFHGHIAQLLFMWVVQMSQWFNVGNRWVDEDPSVFPCQTAKSPIPVSSYCMLMY